MRTEEECYTVSVPHRVTKRPVIFGASEAGRRSFICGGGTGADSTPIVGRYNHCVIRYPRVAAVVASIVLLAGCKKSIQNQDAVRQGVMNYLAKRSDLVAMDVTVNSVSFHDNEATAQVHFQAKGNSSPVAGMTMQYVLERQDNQWVVKGRSGANAHGSSMPGSSGMPGQGAGAGGLGGMPNIPGASGAAPGSLPPGHPAIGGGSQALPPGHPQVSDSNSQK